MPLDRFGKRINIGWAAHEIIWVEAAMTLDREERKQAFRDIASMTGRKFEAVQWRAKMIRLERNRAARAAISGHGCEIPENHGIGLEGHPRPAMGRYARQKYLGTDFAPPDMKRLMAAR